ncbi:MAG: hypothetical protein WCG83_04140 [Candidatus Peregrinibacteria bacterium]
MFFKRKTLIALPAFFLLIFLLKMQGADATIGIASAHAADTALSDTFYGGVIMITGFLSAIFQFVIYLCLYLLSALLDPNFLDLDTTKDHMGAVLLSVWQISRNITNVILALMLIVGAIVTVVQASGNFITTHARNFIIAVIMVNFSWFFPRVIIDAANVLTATIYALPSQIQMAPCMDFDVKGEKTQESCKAIIEYAFFKKPEGNDWTCPLFQDIIADPIVCVRTAPLDAAANQPSAILGGLVFNHARLQYFARLVKPEVNPADPANESADYFKLFTFTLLSCLTIFFSGALAFPLMAMVVALLVRFTIIWLTICFMPFMFIGLVAAGTPLVSMFDPMKEIFYKFVKAAFLPVVIAIPISVGFILLNAASSISPSALPLAQQMLRQSTGIPILAGVANLNQLFWVIMAITFVWKGSFMAFKIDETYDGIGKAFQGSGASIGKFLGKLPLLAPLPLPSGGGMNLLDLGNKIAHPNETLLSNNKFGLGKSDTASQPTQQIVNSVTSTNTANIEMRTKISGAVNAFNATPNDEKWKEVVKRLEESASMAGVTLNKNREELIKLLDAIHTTDSTVTAIADKSKIPK